MNTNNIPQQLPFLNSICWQTKNIYEFSLEEMLSRYERGWSYRKLFDNLEDEEYQFIYQLAKKYKSWLLTELNDDF